jgi:hypothetical protein
MRMRAGLFCLAGLAGLAAVASAPQPGSAQELNRIIGTLNAVLNPQDAQRLEERARREGREDERRYWRDYRAGLEHRPPPVEERRYGEGERSYHEIDAEEARRLEERSRRNHRLAEERYWRDYRAGLGDRPSYDRPVSGIDAEEARRYEERSRRAHRLAEERYWRDYRAGLEGRPRE